MKNWMHSILREENPGAPEGGGGGSGNWYEGAGLAEDTLQTEGLADHLGRYESIDEALKGGFEAKRTLSQKQEGMIKLPGEGATDEDREAFYNSLGRPEAADAYSWEAGDGFEVDADVFKERSEALHAAGLTDAQHSAVLDMYKDELGRMEQTMQAEQAEIARETEAALKTEWGKDYDAHVQSAKAVAEKYGIIEAAKESGLINNLGVIKLLNDFARATEEGKIDPSKAPGGAGIEQQLADLKNHPAWHDKSHPDHRSLVEKTIALRAQG